MAHFGDCCDPFMRLRMASNGYEAISVSFPSLPRTLSAFAFASVFSLGFQGSPEPRVLSSQFSVLSPWSSVLVSCSRLTIFSLQLRLRFLLWLCFGLLAFPWVFGRHIWKMSPRLQFECICVRICVRFVQVFCIFGLLLILQTWHRGWKNPFGVGEK